MEDSNPILWQLLLQFCLIMVNAVFACAEIALISISDTKLEKMSADGDKRAKRLLALTKQPARFLATIQVGITLAGFLGSAFAADNFSEKITAWAVAQGIPIPISTIKVISVVIITVILSFFTLVLGELVPKRVAMKKADTLALIMSGLILTISRVFAPVVWLLTRSTNGILRLLRIDPETEDSIITEEEIRLMIDAGSARGAINANEKEIIHNVFEFDDIGAAEIMTHRRYVTFLDLRDDDEKWETIIKENRHRLYPLCDGDPDRITGVLSAGDYLRLDQRDRRNVLARAVRPPQLVPATVKADQLFRNMKKKHDHFALVIDEYGSMLGIVTMNDLLELLVGDLDYHVSTAERPAIETLGPGAWRINGAASLDRVVRETGRSLPVDQYDTFAGFVFSVLGRVPPDGEQSEFEDCGLKIRVIRIKDRRLEEALVTLA
ncbi:MAG: hemolysin family protein [Treponema sp.]|jgi:putative hemolysin|nr:hemolysin family protein [Treponema sp.]